MAKDASGGQHHKRLSRRAEDPARVQLSDGIMSQRAALSTGSDGSQRRLLVSHDTALERLEAPLLFGDDEGDTPTPAMPPLAEVLVNDHLSPMMSLKSSTSGKTAGLDRAFWRRFYRLWRIAFPTICCRNSLILYLLIVLNCAVGLLLVQIQVVIGPFVNAIVQRTDSGGPLLELCVIIGVAAILQSVIALVGEYLRLDWRRDTLRYIHRRYFTGKLAYWLNTLDDNVDSVDQRIASDVESLTVAVGAVAFGSYAGTGATLWGVLTLLVGSLVTTLTRLPVLAIGLGAAYFGGVSIITTLLMIPVIRATYRSTQMQGAFRFQHVRVKEFCECICFYAGQAKEWQTAELLFRKMYLAFRSLYKRTFWVNAWNLSAGSLVSVYGAWIIVALLELTDQSTFQGVAVDEGSVTATQGIIGSFIGALVALPVLYSAIGQIAGFTHRVGQLMEALDEIDNGSQRIAEHFKATNTDSGIGTFMLFNATPDGKPLYKNLTFEVTPGKDVIIMGASGCGKSSLLRIIAGLWPYDQGDIKRPRVVGKGGVFFVPQRTYVTEGSLREQLIYPHTPQEQHCSDDELISLLRSLDIGHLAAFPGGLSAEQPWATMLSGGEAQRLGFVRLLYHKPKFAIMDEATSALDVPLEARAMRMCKDAGITCISVGHRPTLLAHHAQVLHLTGGGQYLLTDVTDEQRRDAAAAEALESVGDASSTSASSDGAAEAAAGDRLKSTGSVDPEVIRNREKASPTITLDETADELSEVHLDKVFFKRLFLLLRSGFPELFTKQTGVLIFTLLLTACSSFINIIPASLSGPLVESVVHGVGANATNATATGGVVTYHHDFGGFYAVFLASVAVYIVAQVVNAFATWLGQVVSLYWYDAIVRDAQTIYFENNVMYATNNITREIDNVDQRIVADAFALTTTFGVVAFGGASSALMTIIIVLITLFTVVGPLVPLLCLAWAILTVAVSLRVMRPITSAVYRKNLKEGNFRFSHARIIEYAESVAFYDGGPKEHKALDRSFDELYDAYKHYIKVSFPQQSLVRILTISSGILGFIFYMLNNAIFGWPAKPNIPQLYFVAGTVAQLMSALMQIPGYLTTIAQVAGYAHRVSQLLDGMVKTLDQYRKFDVEQRIQEGFNISLERVTVRTPSGVLIFRDMTFDVHKGDSLIIMGPSGSGKSSLLRVIGGLWPFDEGVLKRPRRVGGEGCFFLPQQPYITEGTLREQLLYPHTVAQQTCDDLDLIELLQTLGLRHLLQRKGGLDAPGSWADELSGGEQQRLGFVRLLYHRPRFAIMDESTSALDVELEAKAMQLCLDAKITCISVGHRPTLCRFHKRILRLDGTGGYRIEEVDLAALPGGGEEPAPSSGAGAAATAE